MDAIEQIKDIDLRTLLPDGGARLNSSGMMCCPFPGHDERAPSFKFYPGTNSWMCWGERIGGSTIDYYMRANNCDARTAIRELAATHNIELTPPTPEQEAKQAAERRRENALAWAAHYYHEKLKPETDQWAYMLSRGWTAETIKDLRLGWADKSLANYVARYAQQIEKDGIAVQDLYEAGILRRSERDGSTYEFFRHRITIPWVVRGRVVGMSGRAWGNDDPKYMNLAAPIPALFNQDCIKQDKTILVEGLADAITAYQMDLPAAGLPGTGGIRPHLERLANVRQLYLCMDTDKAGQEAIERNGREIHMAMKSGEVRVLCLPPEHKDLNAWHVAGAGPNAVRQLMENAPTLLEWLLARTPAKLSAFEQEVRIMDLLRLAIPMGPLQRSLALDKIRGAFKGVKATNLAKMLDRIEARTEAADGPATDAGPTLKFEGRRERIPAQCYTFNSPAEGNMTVYLPVERTRANDQGDTETREAWEPVIITVVHEEGKMSVTALPAADLDLVESERTRIPFQSRIKGRWRIEACHPYSVQRFTTNAVPHVSGWDLFTAIRETFTTYSLLRPAANYDLLAAFILLTYVYQLVNAVPYLHLTGVKQSGKSNNARLLDFLCFNASKSSNQTGAVLFRGIESTCGTVVAEEAERLANPKPGTPDFDLMLMFNDGYKRGAQAERIRETGGKDAPKGFEIQGFDVYGPKVMASISDLDDVLSTRVITILHQRANRDDLRESGIRDMTSRWRHEEPRLQGIRDQLHCWALQSFPDVNEAYDDLDEDVDVDHLVSRQREMWLPLLAIARHIDSEHAIALAGGDLHAAEAIFDGWMEAWRANPADETMVFARLVALQREKEKVVRANETEQSIDIAVLRAMYDLINEDRIGPGRSDLVNGALYVIGDLARCVTTDLQEAGILQRDRVVSGRKLTAILCKTGARDHTKHFHVYTGTDPETNKRRSVRGVALGPEVLASTIERLGGSVSGIL